MAEFVLDTWLDGPRLTALDLGVTPHGWHAVGVEADELRAFIYQGAVWDPNGTWRGCEVTVTPDGLVVTDGNEPDNRDLDMHLPWLTFDEVEAAGGDGTLRDGHGPYARFIEWTFIPAPDTEESK